MVDPMRVRTLAFTLLWPLAGAFAAAPETGLVAAKPLVVDPVCDGAADPTVIWNPQVGKWWMFYTNRRANVPGLSGVAWVHGSKIGIAESADRGAHWSYVGTADIPLPPEIGGDQPTEWAPDVIAAPDGTFRMFVSVVPGIFEDWKHPRRIVEVTSSDLRHWTNPRVLSLVSDRVIDPSLCRLPDGTWRMWYNNERDHKSTYYADGSDLDHWTQREKAIGTGDQAGEGPKIFTWHGSFWMIVDVWHGLAVYRSTDALHWQRQSGDNLVAEPGRGPDDGAKGGHPDVVVSGNRAYLFYFVHPGWTGSPAKQGSTGARRSVIQVTELHWDRGTGRLSCDRDLPTHIDLQPLKPAA